MREIEGGFQIVTGTDDESLKMEGFVVGRVIGDGLGGDQAGEKGECGEGTEIFHAKDRIRQGRMAGRCEDRTGLDKGGQACRRTTN
ncbi:MAG: hypothetical protein HYV75_02780 [Opitutae bacterium]|nr:hypothetical protein [Opitutae bacterium]